MLDDATVMLFTFDELPDLACRFNDRLSALTLKGLPFRPNRSERVKGSGGTFCTYSSLNALQLFFRSSMTGEESWHL